jgi:hypothetical protein
MGTVTPDHDETQPTPIRATAPGGWGSPWLQLPLQLIALGLTAFLINRMALDAASGVVRIGPGPTFDTEFVDGAWWLANLVLCVPLWAFGRQWWRPVPCLLAAVAVAAPSYWAFDVMLARYAASGWSQGLEYLGIIFPVGFSLCFILTLAMASASSPRRRPTGNHARRGEFEPAH